MNTNKMLYDALVADGHNVAVWADDPMAVQGYADAIRFRRYRLRLDGGFDAYELADFVNQLAAEGHGVRVNGVLAHSRWGRPPAR